MRPALATAASAALLAGALLAPLPGSARDVPPPPSSGSSLLVAEIEKFSLPSYDASKSGAFADSFGAEVATVNKKTLQDAQRRREAADASPEKLEADRLRRAEKDGGSLLNSLVQDADAKSKQAVVDEIAESRANRWKTF